MIRNNLAVIAGCLLTLLLAGGSGAAVAQNWAMSLQGQSVRFQSENFPGRYLRHQNHVARLTPLDSELDFKDATFRMVPGLADSTAISFEASNFPGHYLRHQNYELKLQRADGSDLFGLDATFRAVPGLANGGMVSFESVNYPGHFLRHANFLFALARGSDELFRRDATFIPEPVQTQVKAPAGQCFWLQNSANVNWVLYGNLSRRECFENDSCNGGMGRSGGGCYKWAACPTCPAESW